MSLHSAQEHDHRQGAEPAFVKVLETDALSDIALIKGALDGSGVRYFLQGENLKFIRPVDPVVLMVAAADLARALELLKPLKLRYAPPGFGKP